MFCTNCGQKLDDDCRFCTQCGTQIVLVSNDVPQNDVPLTENTGTDSPVPIPEIISVVPKASAKPPKEKKKRKKVDSTTLLCIGFLVIAACGTTLYYTIFGNSTDRNAVEHLDNSSFDDTINPNAPGATPFPNNEAESSEDENVVEIPIETPIESPLSTPDTQSENQFETIVCSECGSSCSDDAILCPACGIYLNSEAQSDEPSNIDVSDMQKMWFTGCITSKPNPYYSGTSIDIWQANSYKEKFRVGSVVFEHGLGIYNGESTTQTWEFSPPDNAKVLSFEYGPEAMWCYGDIEKFGTARFIIFGSNGQPLFDSGLIYGFDDGSVFEPISVEIDISSEVALSLCLITDEGKAGTVNVVLGNASVYFEES